MKTTALLLLTVCLSLPPASAESLVRDGDRIILVGDSITGQSHGDAGYAGFLREGFELARPGSKVTVIPLGGSGHNMWSWQNIERDSREKNFPLDIAEFDVKKTLDGGAEVVVVMLGMNDVLRPYMDDSPETVEKWGIGYRDLVKSLKERVKPRVMALATPTLCTEDESSPKNQVLDELSVVIEKIAKEEDCVFLPVRAGFKEMLHEGRTYHPEFHVTNDFVHPNHAGHLAIATAMLKGLGEDAAASAVSNKHAPGIFAAAAGKLPALSYELEWLPGKGDEQTFKIRYWLTTAIPREKDFQAKVSLKAPEGWTVSTPTGGAEGEFTVNGPLDRLRNIFTLLTNDAGGVQTEFAIPAPWLLGIGNGGRKGWVDREGLKYDSAEGVFPEDASLVRGIGFDKPLTGADFAKPIEWNPYVASVNYTGGNDPGSVDFAAVGWFGVFDVAYGVRWINSPSERTVPVEIGANTFAGDRAVAIWINGKNVWASMENSGKTEITLHKGWNPLVFKSNHLEWQWQWQFQIRLLPTAEDDLSDLRFSIVPKTLAE